MPAVRVRPVSPLWSLDRELDYLVSEDQNVTFGQRVLIPLGKQKAPELALVVGTLAESSFATRHIERVLVEPPLITPDHLSFLEQVARRCCVSVGEILGLAIPDFMPRIASSLGLEPISEDSHSKHSLSSDRVAILSRPRSSSVGGELLPDWVQQAVTASRKVVSEHKSVLICVPEQTDIDLLVRAFSLMAAEVGVVHQIAGETRSQRYARYRALQHGSPKVALVTRSGILWRVGELGLIIIHDELDDSLREQGTPFYSAWEIALLRASDEVGVLFISPYRSAQLQRLVRKGYVSSIGSDGPIRGIEFSRPDELAEKSILPFLRKAVQHGTALIITTRKGSNASIRCDGCGALRTCQNCGGPFWANADKRLECRVCRTEIHGFCQSCGADKFKLGKLGLTRIAADLGRALPGTRIIEIDAGSDRHVTNHPNQIVVATPGSAAYLPDGYSGLVIFDGSAWQATGHPTSQLIGHRDWLAAIELLAPDAPIYVRNVDPDVAQVFALGGFIQTADDAVKVATENNLFPESKYFRIEADSQLTEEVSNLIFSTGAELLKITPGERATLVGRLSTSKTLAFVDAIRPWLRIQKPSRANPKRRPVTIEIDFEAWR